MSTVEAISFASKADIPATDSPEALVDGLENRVRNGLTGHFDDVAWIYYYDTAERMALLGDPAFKALLDRLGDNARQDDIDESTRPNITPGHNDSVRQMRDQKGRGGSFFRLSLLDVQRFVIAPAYFPESMKPRDIELDLSRGICFDGKSLVSALFNQGYEAEIIDYRSEPSFPAYRENTIGKFISAHTIEA